ncbi:MAG: SH3 domain-containing protein [Cyanothece sp. SIO2G6]|nr:SH3 domain-containing protein [Cyanothece sp. SIO2G6]
MNRSKLMIRVGIAFGSSLVALASLGEVAIARDNSAGIGYSSQQDVSYCSTYLTARDQGAQINVREGPGNNHGVRHYGLRNDWIDILNRNGNPNEWMYAGDERGYTWYQIGFPASRAYGWVREEFVQLPPAECRN